MPSRDEALLLNQIVENLEGRLVNDHEVLVDQKRFKVVVFVLPMVDERRPERPWKETFLEWLRLGRTVKVASELAGVTRRHAYRCKQTDKTFRKEWEAVRREQRRRRR